VLTELQKALYLKFNSHFADKEAQKIEFLSAIKDASKRNSDKYNEILKRILKRNVLFYA